jgi:hypothetical protein
VSISAEENITKHAQLPEMNVTVVPVDAVPEVEEAVSQFG